MACFFLQLRCPFFAPDKREEREKSDNYENGFPAFNQTSRCQGAQRGHPPPAGHFAQAALREGYNNVVVLFFAFNSVGISIVDIVISKSQAPDDCFFFSVANPKAAKIVF